MSILINGMTMPESCSVCLLAKLSPTGESLICGYMLSRVPWDERPFDCPLVPVPPHGRLIDADALTRKLQSRWSVAYDYEFANHDVWREIREAPIIIEAEEGET